MRKAVLLHSLAAGLVLAMPAGAFAQHPQNDLAVCEHPALSKADQANCKARIGLAKTHEERAEIRAEYEKKIQAK